MNGLFFAFCSGLSVNADASKAPEKRGKYHLIRGGLSHAQRPPRQRLRSGRQPLPLPWDYFSIARDPGTIPRASHIGCEGDDFYAWPLHDHWWRAVGNAGAFFTLCAASTVDGSRPEEIVGTPFFLLHVACGCLEYSPIWGNVTGRVTGSSTIRLWKSGRLSGSCVAWGGPRRTRRIV